MGKRRRCPDCGQVRMVAGAGNRCRACYGRLVGARCYSCGRRSPRAMRLCLACVDSLRGINRADPTDDAIRAARVPIYVDRAALGLDLFSGSPLTRKDRG